MDEGPVIDLGWINVGLDEDLRVQVVEEALRHLKEGAAGDCGLNRVLKSVNPIKGFSRKPTAAPMGMLLPATVEALDRSGDAVVAVTRLWVEGRSILCGDMQSFLRSQEIEPREPSALKKGFEGFHPPGKNEAHLEAFADQYPQYAEGERWLMYVLLRGSLPGSISEERVKMDSEQINGNSETVWDRWLSELENLPADASEWDHADDFVNRVQALAQERQAERSGMRALGGMLDEFRDRYSEEITFFSLEGCCTWAPEKCDREMILEVTDCLNALQVALTDYAALMGTRAAKLAESRARREQLDRLENQVLDAYGQLKKLFDVMPDDEPAPSAEDHAPEDDEEAEEAPDPEKGDRETGVAMGQKAETEESDPNATEASDEKQGALEPDPTPEEHDEKEPAAEVVADESESVATEDEPDALGDDSKPEKPTGIDGAGDEDEEGGTLPKEVAAPPSESELDAAGEEEPPAEEPPVGLDSAGTAFEKDTSQATELLTPEEFVWGRLVENDVPAAYWYVRSQEAVGEEPELPSWLLAALQGARWLESDERMLDGLAPIAYRESLDASQSGNLLGVAAALYPVLVAPESNMIGWIDTALAGPELEHLPGVKGLVGAVKDFAQRGYPVYPEMLAGALTREKREEQLKRPVQDAVDWLSQAPSRETNYARATQVWRELVRDQDGPIPAFLKLVRDDKRSEMGVVEEAVRDWNDRQYIDDQIQRIDRARRGRRGSQIEASARDQITRRVQDACQIASAWCRRVRQDEAMEQQGGWLGEQVQGLADRVREFLPAAEQDLKALAGDTRSVKLSALGLQLKISLSQIRRLLLLEPGETGEKVMRYPSLTGDLISSLALRLLWLPECPLNDDGIPPGDAMGNLTEIFEAGLTKRRTIAEVLEQWFEREDYRFVEPLLSAVADSEQEISLNRDHVERYSSSRQRLQQRLDEATGAVEKAVVDGVMLADDRSAYSEIVEGVRNRLEGAKNITLLHRQLERVDSDLDAAYQKRITIQRRRWEKIKPRLDGLFDEPDARDLVVERVERALDQKHIRVTDEYMSELVNKLEEGTPVELGLFQPREAKKDVLQDYVGSIEDFYQFLHGINNQLRSLSEQIQKTPGRHSIMSMRNLPKPRVEEVAGAIRAWKDLKHGRQQSTQDQAQMIRTLLEYLGFRMLPSPGGPVNLVQDRDSDLAHWQVKMSAVGLSPVPQFGSTQEGHFQVVCIWERPGTDRLGAQLRRLELENQPVLALYFGQLLSRQREDILRFSRQQAVTLAVLDEILLLYLARVYETRLGTFMEAALPFTVVNPYVPFSAGTVPPEMFFGRTNEKRALQDPAGPCIVYGGRQLGKSALLRQVYREFHNPEREQYALLEDIKLLGDPTTGQDTEILWTRLRSGLIGLGLLDERASERPERLRERILKLMAENPQRRLLVLLDETDKFLVVDSERSFQIVSQLKEIMDATGRRFKVVLAGLHNVQRFQGLVNQPLAHMGHPVAIGPLEPEAAVQLVRGRMEPLGFRFDDDSLVLRILSYTNYHPGLIQLFCHDLVRFLHERRRNGRPPHKISTSDVESVHSRVREGIRERFEWTLALDARYRVIALTMIAEQLEAQDSFAQVYSWQELLEMSREWWPRWFGDVESEQFRGFLDEMKGLGVLASAKRGYRLRSPNLVRLMGTEDEVLHTLAEITAKQPRIEFDADSHHALLDPAAQRYSPLSYVQERLLNQFQFGVGLVFGSDALGLAHLREATKRFIPPDLTRKQGIWSEVTVVSNSGQALRQWLEKHMDRNAETERLVVFHDLKGTTAQLAEQVEAALAVCQRFRRRRGQWMRIILALDPYHTWRWLKLPAEHLGVLENTVDAAVSLRRWNQVGVRQRLSQHKPEILASDDSCNAVLKVTGGWYYLVNEFVADIGQETDPRPHAPNFLGRLENDKDPLSGQFRERLGKFMSPAARQVYLSIQGEGRVPTDLFRPDMLSGCEEMEENDFMAEAEYLERLGLLERDGNDLMIESLSQLVLLEDASPPA